VPANDAAEPAALGASPAAGAPRKASRLWLWFVAAFLVQLAAWTTWILIASHHRVQEVPLATQGSGVR
jgi:hypothetical protein